MGFQNEHDSFRVHDSGISKFYTIQRAIAGQCFGDADFSLNRLRTCKAVVASSRVCFIAVDKETISLLKLKVPDLKLDLKTIANLKDRHWSSLMQIKEKQKKIQWPEELDQQFQLASVEQYYGKSNVNKKELELFQYNKPDKGIFRTNLLKKPHLELNSLGFFDLGIKHVSMKRKAKPLLRERYKINSTKSKELFSTLVSSSTEKKHEKSCFTRNISLELDKRRESYMHIRSIFSKRSRSSRASWKVEPSTSVEFSSDIKALRSDEISHDLSTHLKIKKW